MEESGLICCRCNLPLEKRNTNFFYMGFSFHTDLLRCPRCGQVYIPEELVDGKISEVEMELEEK